MIGRNAEKTVLKRVLVSEVPYEVRVYTGNKSGAGTGERSIRKKLETLLKLDDLSLGS